LSGITSIKRHCGPVVSPVIEIRSAEVDHWFLPVSAI
jgi:hypothetical protein